MSTFELTREEQEAMTEGEVRTTKLLWENNNTSSKKSTSSDLGSVERVENIIEKEVLLARERERQLRKEREERTKQLTHEEEQVKKDHTATTNNIHHPDTHVHQHHDDVTVSKDTAHGHGTPVAASTSSHTTDPHTPSDSHTTSKVAETNHHNHNNQHHHNNTHVSDSIDGDNTSKATPTPTVPMTYEEIIAEPKHKGEGLVFDEIQQQKAREDELRRNYGDRGIQLASYQSSSVITVSRPAAANHSEPVAQHHDNNNHNQQQQHSAAHHNGVDKPTSPAHSDEHHVSARKVSTSETSPAVAAAKSNSNNSHNSNTSSSPSETKDLQESLGRRQSSVHRNSWLMTDTTDSTYRYMPHVETPIEREIRLNQERESELRSKTATLNRGESVEQKTSVPIAASSIRRQRQDKTDVNVKEKRRTFEVESEANNNNGDSVTSSGKWDKRRASEIVIEKEMREMRVREEELRLTRINNSD